MSTGRSIPCGFRGARPARLAPVAAVVVLALIGGPHARAAGQERIVQHPEAREAIAGLRSPYCPGLMLEVCTSSGAAALRDSIQSMAEAGMEADEIVEHVLAEYGEEWRAVPRRTGAGLWVWVLPYVFLSLGLAIVLVRVLRRRRKEPVQPRELGEDDEARLSEALHDLEESERPNW